MPKTNCQLRTPDPVRDAKAALRKTAKGLRAAIAADTRRQAADAIISHGLALLEKIAPQAAIIGGFMPIGEEISPLGLMLRLETQGCRLALPVMVGKSAPLEFRSYAPGDALASAIWGIREPQADKPSVQPDVVLVALLAFDDQGYRLGYGGGYYDRTIRALRATKAIVTVGLAYDEQRVDAVPRSDYDERLDWILTPSGVRRAAH